MGTGSAEVIPENSYSPTTGPHHGHKAGAIPRGPFNNKRDVLTTRITKETRDALEAASRVSGRSLSQEIEVRLNQSFSEDRRAELFRDGFYGPEFAALLELLGRAMQETGRRAAMEAGAGLTDWLDSPSGYAHAARAALEILNKLAPSNRPEHHVYRKTKIAPRLRKPFWKDSRKAVPIAETAGRLHSDHGSGSSWIGSDADLEGKKLNSWIW